MDNYFSMSIQGVGLLVLETVHIIATTKNFDTLKGRYELLVERLDTLRKAESNQQYSADINTSIETYKSMYYDRPLQEFEISSVLKPNIFNAQNFYCDALANCINRFTREQINEIGNLKSENAKIKRRSKVIEKINLAKNELQNKCSSTPSYLSALNSLEQYKQL